MSGNRKPTQPIEGAPRKYAQTTAPAPAAGRFPFARIRLPGTAVPAALMASAFAAFAASAARPVPVLLSDAVVTTESFSKPVAYGDGLNGLSFQQDAVLSHKGWQYVAYYNAARHVCVARRKLPSGAWQILELKDYTQKENDSHNTISLGICSQDGTIHLSFDHHDNDLHYRKSVAGLAASPDSFSWDASRFGAVTNQLTGSRLTTITYPRFVSEPSGKMLMEFRIGASGEGDCFLYEYDGTTGRWTKFGTDSRYLDGVGNNAYINGLDYGKGGRLHVTWCWRETPDVVSNHDLLYAYSDDDGRTWKNNAGTEVGRTGSKYISPSTPGIAAWSIPQNSGIVNQEAQGTDPQGRIHVFIRTDSTLSGGTRRPFHTHFWRDESGKWTRINTGIPSGSPTGDRGKILFDREGNAFALLPGFRIASASAAEKWADWKVTYAGNSNLRTMEPLFDRARLAEEGVLSVFWQEITTTGKGTLRIQDFRLGPVTTLARKAAPPPLRGDVRRNSVSAGWGWLRNAAVFGLDGRVLR
jgi:hypothetical protein